MLFALVFVSAEFGAGRLAARKHCHEAAETRQHDGTDERLTRLLLTYKIIISRV